MDHIKTLNHDKILKKILDGGGEYAELYYEKSYGTSVICEDDRIEKVISGIDTGVGLRLIKNFKTAYAFTNELTENALLSMAADLSQSLLQDKDDAPVFALKRIDPSFVLPVRIHPDNVDVARRIEMVTRANEFSRAQKNIRQVRVIFRDSMKEVFVANSDGDMTHDHRTGTVFMVEAVVMKGDDVQTGREPVGGSVGFEIFDDMKPEDVARIACDRANLMLTADRAPGGTMPVVLSSEAGGTMIHEAVGHGLEADLAEKGLSVYSGKLNTQVASELISVVDDSSIPLKRGSYVFDDEGTPSSRTLLVDRGVLVALMNDKLMAKKTGVAPTGNGRRESYRTKPIPRMSNTLIVSGAQDPADIINSVDKGLLVKKMGGGQVNTINGQFVFEVSEGYLIENGKVKAPVKGAILTGNGPQVLMDIDMVGNDLGYAIGTCGKDGQGVPVADAQPTLRIPAITVGGKV